MKRKVDFTVKGTKLPVIPKGTEFNIKGNEFEGVTKTEFNDLFSFGRNDELEIYADEKGYVGKNPYIFKLSTIERLAEEQGMLWVEVGCEEEKYYDGVKFHYDGERDIWELKKQSGGYGIVGVSLPSVIPVERVVSNFADGTWIEEKEEAEDLEMAQRLDNFESSIKWKTPQQHITTASIEQLLLDAVTLNNSIKRGFSLFASIDEKHRLSLIKDAQKQLAKTVAELNLILNPPLMRSCVELAEDMVK